MLQDSTNTYQEGPPRRHVMAVRSDQGCFAVLWELSVARLHKLGELEAAAAAAAAVAAAPVHQPAVQPAVHAAAGSSAASHMDSGDLQASILARIHAHMHSTAP